MESKMQLYVPGLTDFVKISEALQKKDEGMIWEAAKASTSQADFFDQLRNECSMTIFNVGSRRSKHAVNHHSALFMIPVIVSPETAALVANSKGMRPVVVHLARWVRDWFANTSEVAVFNVATAYEEICAWSPLVMRDKLLQLTKQSDGMSYECVDMDFNLPPTAPRLTFLLAGLQKPLEIPSLPKVNPVADATFRSRVEGAIQIVSPSERMVEVQVDLPDYASVAIQRGLVQWLDALHRMHPIKRWDAMPAGNDAVFLKMEIEANEPCVSGLMLRAHQLGMEGVSHVLSHLALLAPTHGSLYESSERPAPMH